MSISSDEVNFLIYRYLQENGFAHSAFTFAYESLVIKSSASQTEIPPGALITFLQKGLEYIAIEEHILEDGTIQEFDNNYSLLSPIICEAIAVKEDRRPRNISLAAGSTSSLPLTSSGDNLNSSSSLMASSSSNLMSNNLELSLNSSENLLNYSFLSQNSIKLLHLKGHNGEIFMNIWNPKENILASGSADGICRLWNFNKLKSSTFFNPSNTSGLISSTTASSATNNLLTDGASANIDGQANTTENSLTTNNNNLFDEDSIEFQITSTILPHISLEGEKMKDVTSISWSSGGNFLATGCYDGITRVWHSNGSNFLTFNEHSGPVFSLKFNKNAKEPLLLSGSYDKKSILWNVISGKIIRVTQFHEGPVLDVDWRDDEIYATCSSDKTIYIYSVHSDQAIHHFSGHTDEVNIISWSSCGNYLASCSDDGSAKIWDYNKKALKFNLVGHSKEIFTLKWINSPANSPSKSSLLATASFDGSIKLWHSETGELVYNLVNFNNNLPVYSLASSPNGNFLVSGSLGGNISIWNVKDGTLIKEINGTGDTFDVNWSHDGKFLSACFSSGALLIINMEDFYHSNDAPSSVPAISNTTTAPAPSEQNEVKVTENSSPVQNEEDSMVLDTVETQVKKEEENTDAMAVESNEPVVETADSSSISPTKLNELGQSSESSTELGEISEKNETLNNNDSTNIDTSMQL